MPSLSATETRVIVNPDYDTLCEYVAERIADLVRVKPDAVLGLATGATPIGVYAALVRRHREDRLDFSQVTCFNLDEYYPMSPNSPHSYRQFMRTHLFEHIKCRSWHIPDGRRTSIADLDNVCAAYEDAIREAGGIDLQLLGIGRTGHMGFNEPGSSLSTRTRVVTLDEVTRADAAPGFGGLNAVPAEAITMGIGTILEARQLVMLASGASKADVVRCMMTGTINDKLPASFIREHYNSVVCLDAPAAQLL